MDLEIEYKTIGKVTGPLIVVNKVGSAAYNEIVKVKLQDGEERLGQVLETNDKYAVVQVFGQTSGISTGSTTVSFVGETFKIGVSEEMLGRVFDGEGNLRYTKSSIKVDERRNVNGAPINPASRAMPKDFIETGMSAIDGLMTLIRGQKLPIFSSSGLAHNELTAQIARQARVINSNEDFAVVFAGIGITHDDASFFINSFRKSGALKRTVAFMNLADDPSIERILTPRLALTTAEYLAYDKGMHVLVILTDMTNYCESLRELSSAREEVPGRRGYPGYMYTDLASMYERAGIIRNRKGSITQLDILTMPGEDITHPIPDLTGYITEGQIYLDRDLSNKGIYPPINPIGSLSRLMNTEIGKGKTREDHRGLADQLYGFYAKSIDSRNLSAIVGMEALSETERKFLKFGDDFERTFIAQPQGERRDIGTTMDIGWELLSRFEKTELTRIRSEFVEKYHKKAKE
ncbi:MAG: V-type ATP synthase subunit B [Candidatus Micrarchaeaceae archaeon]